MVIIQVGKGNAANLIVAACDAKDSIKALADFVCDGVDDQEEISAAIDSAKVLGGGKVTLIGGVNGSFNLSGPFM